MGLPGVPLRAMHTPHIRVHRPDRSAPGPALCAGFPGREQVHAGGQRRALCLHLTARSTVTRPCSKYATAQQPGQDLEQCVQIGSRRRRASAAARRWRGCSAAESRVRARCRPVATSAALPATRAPAPALKAASRRLRCALPGLDLTWRPLNPGCMHVSTSRLHMNFCGMAPASGLGSIPLCQGGRLAFHQCIPANHKCTRGSE